MIDPHLDPHALRSPCQFVRRHVGPSDRDVDAMMEDVGVKSLDDLVDRTVPHSIRLDKVRACRWFACVRAFDVGS